MGNNKSVVDRGILAPITIGIISTFGIFLVLLTTYLNKSQTSIPTYQTATAFKYILLATETHTSLPQLEGTIPGVKHTEETSISTPSIPIPGRITATSTFASAQPNTSTLASSIPVLTASTSTLDETIVFVTGKYNDTDSRIMYDGDWVNDLFVTGAYQETLYVSPTVDNSAAFVFVGRQLQVGYFGDPDLGTVIISIDGNEYRLNQSNGSEWSSPQLTYGEHSVLIVHESGDLIFLDYINIPS